MFGSEVFHAQVCGTGQCSPSVSASSFSIPVLFCCVDLWIPHTRVPQNQVILSSDYPQAGSTEAGSHQKQQE